jgi:transcriptional regulator with XRE-family HTH domain
MANRNDITLVAQVGRRIRAIRLERGMTQAEVAERASCDPQTIQRAESGKYGLSLNRLEGVARGLGVPVPELFAAVEAAVPDSPWSADDARVVTVWGRVPQERRAMALRVLADIAEG